MNQWLHREESELHIVATYNLLFNASLLVDEGLGYALCYDKLINTKGSNLCFRPFSPRLEAHGFIVWKNIRYALHGNTCINAVITAIKSGYRLIDTASFYGNEREVGEGIRKSGVAREKIFVQTKLYPNQYSQAAKAIDEALKKLNIDYIDMMLLHHPASNDAAAYQAIEKAIQNGKVRTAGISCYYIQETDFFLPKVSVKPALIQNEIHPYYQDSSVVEHIQNKGIIVQSWYPLGGRGYTKALLNDPVLQKIAAAHRKSVAQVILRWNLQKGVCVIPGSSTTEHIRENISIFDFALTKQEMEGISTLNKNEKHDWY